jgi:hypothetical protein
VTATNSLFQLHNLRVDELLNAKLAAIKRAEELDEELRRLQAPPADTGQ